MPAQDLPQMEEMLCNRLKRLGFDPGVVVYLIHECDVTLDQLKASLFDHQWENPRLVTIKEKHSEQRIPLIVESVRTVWQPFQTAIDPNIRPAGVFAQPDLYITGRPLRAYFDGDDPIEIRAYFEGPHEDGTLHQAYVQQVVAPTGADPALPLRYTSEF